MMESTSTIKQIDWKSTFPWLIIFRTLPIAASLPVLIFATIGVVLTPIGWWFSEALFVNETLRAKDPVFFNEFVEQHRTPFGGVLDTASKSTIYTNVVGDQLSGPLLVFRRLVDPVRRMFDTPISFRQFSYLLLGGLWTIGVWSFCGCGIARICLLRLTRDDSPGLDEAFQFSTGRFSTCFSAIILPLLGVAVACVPCFAIGLLLTWNWGTILAGLIWFIVLAIAAVMAVLLLALMFGWPLIICAISAENQNSLDAITRAFAYILQRPFHAAFYSMVSVLFGGLCWLIVAQAAVATVQLGYWGTSWGSNVVDANRMDQIAAGNNASVSQPVSELLPHNGQTFQSEEAMSEEATSLKMGKRIIGFWNGLLFTVAVGFLFGQFWCLTSAVYLLLRKDVDETEMDEIFQTEQKRSYDLPPLKSDAQGIPIIQPLDENAPSKPAGMNEADT
jgi:hypothetical protein